MSVSVNYEEIIQPLRHHNFIEYVNIPALTDYQTSSHKIEPKKVISKILPLIIVCLHACVDYLQLSS